MIKKITFFLLITIIYACATVQSPTGGEKDERAPILYESKPKNQSTNFKGKEITLFFNEWMQLEQLQKELIITPRQEINFKSQLNKQELTITLDSALADSTTYTFNFRKALKDITEGNLWENPVIAFSTGPYLDSLQIQGTVVNTFNNKPQEAYIVGLYSNDYDTANLRQGKPTYFTTTTKEGNYNMKNLKAGKYKLYTFKDSNDNLINESQKEAFGYHTEVINLYDSLGSINLNTYQRNEDTLHLKKYSPAGKDFTIQFNKGLSYYGIIDPSDSAKHIYANDVEMSKNLQVYKENFPNLKYETDSTLLVVNVKDSIGSTITDTVFFRLRESRLTNDTIQIVSKPASKLQSGPQNFEISFSKPVQKIVYDSIRFVINGLTIYDITKQQVSLNYNRKKITIKTDLDENQITATIDSLKFIKQQQDSLAKLESTQEEITDSLKSEQNPKMQDEEIDRNKKKRKTKSTPQNQLVLHLGKGAFIGIENDSTQQDEVAFTFKQPEEYGIIKGKVIKANFPFVIELLNEKFNVQDTLINKTEFEFQYVTPGDYRLRLIKDENGNHKWDPGNPLTLDKSEEYIFFNEILTVKKNWEVIDKNFDFSVDNEVDNSVKEDDL